MNNNRIDNSGRDDKLEVGYSIACLLVLEGTISFPVIMGICAYFKRDFDPEILKGIIIGALPSILIYFWFISIKVTIENGVLTYRELFKKTKVIRLEDIERVYFGDASDRSKPPYRLEIIPRKGCGVEEFYINFKPLEDKGVRQLFEILKDKFTRTPRKTKKNFWKRVKRYIKFIKSMHLIEDFHGEDKRRKK